MNIRFIAPIIVFVLVSGSAPAAWPPEGTEDPVEFRLAAGVPVTEEQAGQDSAPGAGKTSQSGFDKPAFWGVRLINLPTTTAMERKDVLFRISHRFYGPVDEGYDTFFGLDSGANVFFSLGYGLTDRLGITVGRSRLYREWEFGLSWLAVSQGAKPTFPFSAALHAGLDWATVEGSGHLKYSLQLSLSRQITKRLSVMAVPAFSTNTDFWMAEPEGTFSIGLGSRYMILDDFSIVAEWVPVLAGYRDVQNGWGLGFEKKIGGHVFQVFVTNAFGLTSSQVLPGGDLQLEDLDFRIGFNIFRTF